MSTENTADAAVEPKILGSEFPWAEGRAPNVRLVPLNLVDESHLNHRQRFHRIPELAESIHDNGLEQELLGRPHPDDAGRIELVCGARRKRALALLNHKATEAGAALPWPAVPMVLRAMTDSEVLVAQASENFDREQPHPMEEAIIYERLTKPVAAGGQGWSVETTALKTHHDVAHVVATMALLKLSPDWRDAFLDERVMCGHAMIAARIPTHALQNHCLQRVVPTTDARLLSVTAMRELVRREYMLPLVKADFDILDEGLVPNVGACNGCSFNTAQQSVLFADVAADGALCTNPECWDQKCNAGWMKLKAAAAAKGQKVLSDAEAKKVMPWQGAHLANDAPWYVLGSDCYSAPGQKKRTWAQVVKAGAKLLSVEEPPVTIARVPTTGEVVHLVARADGDKLLRALQKQHAEKKGEPAPDDRQQKWKDEQRKAKRDAAIRTQVGAALVGAVILAVERMKSAGDLDQLLAMVCKIMVGHAWYAPLDEVVKRRKLVPEPAKKPTYAEQQKREEVLRTALLDHVAKGTRGQLASLIVEFTLAKQGGVTENDALLSAATFAGVDAKAIKAEVTAAFKKAEKEKASKKKTAPAPAAKVAKGKAGKATAKAAKKATAKAKASPAAEPEDGEEDEEFEHVAEPTGAIEEELEEVQEPEATMPDEQGKCVVCGCVWTSGCDMGAGNRCAWADLDHTMCTACQEIVEVLVESAEDPQAEEELIEWVEEDCDMPCGTRERIAACLQHAKKIRRLVPDADDPELLVANDPELEELHEEAEASAKPAEPPPPPPAWEELDEKGVVLITRVRPVGDGPHVIREDGADIRDFQLGMIIKATIGIKLTVEEIAKATDMPLPRVKFGVVLLFSKGKLTSTREGKDMPLRYHASDYRLHEAPAAPAPGGKVAMPVQWGKRAGEAKAELLQLTADVPVLALADVAVVVMVAGKSGATVNDILVEPDVQALKSKALRMLHILELAVMGEPNPSLALGPKPDYVLYEEWGSTPVTWQGGGAPPQVAAKIRQVEDEPKSKLWPRYKEAFGGEASSVSVEVMRRALARRIRRDWLAELIGGVLDDCNVGRGPKAAPPVGDLCAVCLKQPKTKGQCCDEDAALCLAILAVVDAATKGREPNLAALQKAKIRKAHADRIAHAVMHLEQAGVLRTTSVGGYVRAEASPAAPPAAPPEGSTPPPNVSTPEPELPATPEEAEARVNIIADKVMDALRAQGLDAAADRIEDAMPETVEKIVELLGGLLFELPHELAEELQPEASPATPVEPPPAEPMEECLAALSEAPNERELIVAFIRSQEGSAFVDPKYKPAAREAAARRLKQAAEVIAEGLHVEGVTPKPAEVAAAVNSLRSIAAGMPDPQREIVARVAKGLELRRHHEKATPRFTDAPRTAGDVEAFARASGLGPSAAERLLMQRAHVGSHHKVLVAGIEAARLGAMIRITAQAEVAVACPKGGKDAVQNSGNEYVGENILGLGSKGAYSRVILVEDHNLSMAAEALRVVAAYNLLCQPGGRLVAVLSPPAAAATSVEELRARHNGVVTEEEGLTSMRVLHLYKDPPVGAAGLALPAAEPAKKATRAKKK